MDVPILKTIGKLILFCTALLLVPLHAAPSKAETTLYPEKVSLGSTAVLKVSIEGVGSGVKCEKLPNISGLRIAYSGVQHKFSFVNGRFSKSVVLSYTLHPEKEGTFTIPALTFTDGKASYVSDSVRLSVSAGRSGAGGTSVSRPYGSASGGDSVFTGRCFLSKEEAFVGEPVFLRYYLFSRGSGNIALEGFEKMPETRGFLSKEIEENLPDEVLENSGGNIDKEYICTFILLPAEIGDKQVGGCSALFSVGGGGGFFDFPKRKRILFQPLTITVKPLPEEGKPVDFSGSVGCFTMKLSDYDEAVEVFDEKKLTVTIEGSGNLLSLGKPVFVPADSGVRVFISDGKAAFLPEGDTLKGRVDFDVTFIPEKTGILNAGKFRFAFYDTEEGTYKMPESTQIQLNVTGVADASESFSFDDTEQDSEFRYAPMASMLAGILLIALLSVFIVKRRGVRAALAAQADVKPVAVKEVEDIFRLYKRALYAAELNDESLLSETIDKLMSALAEEKSRDAGAELAVIGQIREEMYALRFGGGQISADKMADWKKRLEDFEDKVPE